MLLLLLVMTSPQYSFDSIEESKLHKTTTLSKSEDDFLLVKFSSVSFHKVPTSSLVSF